MNHLLVPIDADHPERTNAAIAQAIQLAAQSVATVHLLSVQPLVSSHVAMCFPEGALQRLQHAVADEELAPARAQLEAAGVSCQTHVRVGRRAETIVQVASKIGCATIVMAQHSASGTRAQGFGSVAGQVRHLLAGAPGCQVIG